jgi:nucleoside-diphosphate-sugar epimerase
MIIGNGMMANRFAADYSNSNTVLIFASGVSNSSEKNKAAFEREENLLKNCLDKYAYQTFVYFSTCSIYDPSLKRSPYILHKLEMEELIKKNIGRYLICRTSNIVGQKGNPNTLINFLVSKIERQQEFELWTNSFRNILDIDDLFEAVHSTLRNPLTEQKSVLNIYCPHFYTIQEIVSAVETHLGKKAVYTPVTKGSHYTVPETTDLTSFFPDSVSQPKEGYLSKLLSKYHPVYAEAL